MFFDWDEFDEAVDYFARRFAGKDVTISPCGFAFRVIPGPGDWKKPQYMVLRDKKAWQVWELSRKGDKVVKSCRSYEQAAIFLERKIKAPTRTNAEDALRSALQGLLDLDAQGFLHRDKLDTEDAFRKARAALKETDGGTK